MDIAVHTIDSGTHEDPTDLFESGSLEQTEIFSYTFNEPGAHLYQCDPHPFMVGVARANVEPKAKEFSQQIKDDPLRSINKTLSMICDQCGTRQSHEMTPERIAYLLTPDPLWFLPGRGLVECINPTCIEWGFRHHIRVQLKDIIFEYLIQSSRAQES